MARFKTQRGLASTLLYVLTALWAVLWLFGYFTDEPNLAEPSFYMLGTFAAATLVFVGLRGAIEE